MAGILPREGLTLEILLTPLRLIATSPFTTSLILLAILILPQSLLPRLLQSAETSTLGAFLFTAVIIGLVLKLNYWLSLNLVNNWVSDKWQYGKEIVVVTGGASGIGWAVTRELAKSSAAVVILDIQPLEGKLRESTSCS
jgi:all-trans-retinol dehydrogenase (NAD+)